jgi:hypothetical protein
MTEAEWLAAAELTPLLDELQARGWLRKLQLFACACCRRLGRLLDEARVRGLLDRVEVWADQAVPQPRWVALHQEILDHRCGEVILSVPWCAEALGFAARNPMTASDAASAASTAAEAEQLIAEESDEAYAFVERWARHTGDPPGLEADEYAMTWDDYVTRIGETVRDAQLQLLREIAGNPFRPEPIDPSWLSWQQGTILSMARSIYEDRAWDRMPVLGDALEDAGCTNAVILAHCHEDGPHARGCWLVDSLLNKAP